MPKLNTTIDNLEWKSNKVTSASTALPSSWTDTQYPSAKMLFDIAHPIGSTLITESNTNPAAIYGGTWVLVNKSFKQLAQALPSTAWTAERATLSTYGAYMSIAGNTVALRVHLKTTVDIADTTSDINLGTLKVAECGIEQLEFAGSGLVTTDDAQDCVVMYNMHIDGRVAISNTLSKTLKSGADLFLNIVQPIHSAFMKDSFCDQFYWKRTA